MFAASAKSLSDRSVVLVFLCTLIGAAAQVFFKLGSSAVTGRTPAEIVIHVFSSPALLMGFALYGINTLLLILALRKAELSLMYPVISLTYVWVTILSILIFNENMNVWKAGGLMIVIAGVAVLGRGSRS